MGALTSALNFITGRSLGRHVESAAIVALGSRELAAPTVIEGKPEAKVTRSKAIGGAGSRIWAGNIDDMDASSDVRGDRWYGDGMRQGVAEQMLRDPHIRASVSYITDPVSSAVWDFEPASDSDLDKEISDFAYWMLIERLDWTATVEQILRYNIHGVSLFEVTDDVRPVPTARFPRHLGRGQAILPTGIHQRMPSTVARWNQSGEDPTKLASITQRIWGSDKEEPGEREIPADRLLRWTWEQDAARFTGFSPLRSCYGAWKTKLLLRVIDAIRHERQGLGTPTITLPGGATDDDKAEAAIILRNMRANDQGYMVLWNGFKFEWSTTGAGVSTNILEAIRYCDDEIAANFKVGFMRLGTGGGGGSYALAATQEGNYQISLDKHARFICRGINRGSDGWSFVSRYIRLNYGDAVDLPTLVARNMPTKDLKGLTSSIVSLAQQGFITPDEPTEIYLREAFSLPLRDPKTSRKGEQAPAADAPKTDTPAPEAQPEATASTTTEPTEITDAVDNGKAAAAASGAALNGAQVTSFRQILIDVATRQMPRESGVAFIAAAFPIGTDKAEGVMGAIGKTFFVELPSAPVFGAPASPPVEPDEEPDDAEGEEDE